MPVELRPYQIDLIDRVRKSMQSGNRKVVMQALTGLGKTVVASEIVKQTVLNGYKVLFIADRRKLIDQTSEKLSLFGVDHGIIMAGRPPDWHAPVQVATIQTLYSRAIKREVMGLPEVHLLVIDEAHKSLGDQYKDLVDNHYRHAFVLGMTATPYRSDGRGMNELYEDLVLGPDPDFAVENGYLVSMRYYAPTAPDMAYLESIVDKQKGDYNEAKLGEYMERDKPLIGDIVEHYKRLGEDKQAVVFASSVRHSMYIAEAFNRAGIAAEHIDGTTYHMERQRIYEDIHAGKTRVVTNYGVLCLDTQTEILTSSGWVGPDEMTTEHFVANYDDGNAYFEKPSEVVRRKRMPWERMVISGGRHDLRVTEGHWMLHGGRHLLKSQARDIVGKAIILPVSAMAKPIPGEVDTEPGITPERFKLLVSKTAYNLRQSGTEWGESFEEAQRRVSRKATLSKKRPRDLSVDELRFIGFFIGDGGAYSLSSGGVEYRLYQPASNEWIIDWIDLTIKNLGYSNLRKKTPNPFGGSDGFKWSLPRGTGGGPQERTGVYPIEDYLNKSSFGWLWELDESQILDVLIGFWIANGEHSQPEIIRDSYRVCSRNKVFLDSMQAVMSVRGYKTSITVSSDGLLFYLNVSKVKGHRLTGSSMLRFEEGWADEDVWCVKTSSKNIITRRNGKVTVMGNCEGWDEPQMGVCILARPTKSVSTFLQMAGRILRPYPGKDYAILIDHSGSVRELGFVHDKREWTLEPTKEVSERTPGDSEDMEFGEDKDENIVCEQCHTVYRGRRKCPECGWEPPKRKPKPVKVLQAELEELLAAKAHDDYKVSFFERALAYEKMGKVPKGWAIEAWRLKFKEQTPPPVKRLGIPDDEIKRWHQHMLIREKYRKNPRRKVVNL